MKTNKNKGNKITEDSAVSQFEEKTEELIIVFKELNEDLEEANNLINQMNKNEDEILYLLEKIKEEGSNEK